MSAVVGAMASVPVMVPPGDDHGWVAAYDYGPAAMDNHWRRGSMDNHRRRGTMDDDVGVVSVVVMISHVLPATSAQRDRQQSQQDDSPDGQDSISVCMSHGMAPCCLWVNIRMA